MVMDPDYLPDAEVLAFSRVYTPLSMYTLPCGGVQRGGTPSAGSGGKRAPSGGSGEKPLKQNCLIKVYCNFIVNLDRSL